MSERLSFRAFGYTDRLFEAVVDINGIKRVPPPTRDTWESLILPRGHKDMVYSLVQSHFRDRQQSRGDSEVQADLVRGKGEILINRNQSSWQALLIIMPVRFCREGLDYSTTWRSWSRKDVDCRYVLEDWNLVQTTGRLIVCCRMCGRSMQSATISYHLRGPRNYRC